MMADLFGPITPPPSKRVEVSWQEVVTHTETFVVEPDFDIDDDDAITRLVCEQAKWNAVEVHEREILSRVEVEK